MNFITATSRKWKMNNLNLTDQEADWLLEWLQIQSDEEMFSNFSQMIINQITTKLKNGQLDHNADMERNVGTF